MAALGQVDKDVGRVVEVELQLVQRVCYSWVSRVVKVDLHPIDSRRLVRAMFLVDSRRLVRAMFLVDSRRFVSELASSEGSDLYCCLQAQYRLEAKQGCMTSPVARPSSALPHSPARSMLALQPCHQQTQ